MINIATTNSDDGPGLQILLGDVGSTQDLLPHTHPPFSLILLSPSLEG